MPVCLSVWHLSFYTLTHCPLPLPPSPLWISKHWKGKQVWETLKLATVNINFDFCLAGRIPCVLSWMAVQWCSMIPIMCTRVWKNKHLWYNQSLLWQASSMRLGFTAKVGRIWKWSYGVEISEMGIFWCISITNNVESCKKINEKAQTANFSVLARGRRPRKELFAKNMENKRK